MSVDLGAGKSTLTLANATNTGTVNNVETLIGGTGADTITLGTAMADGSVNLGSGVDTLTLGNFSNTGTISNVKTIIGGTGNDTITLGQRRPRQRQRQPRQRRRHADPGQVRHHRHGRQRDDAHRRAAASTASRWAAR